MYKNDATFYRPLPSPCFRSPISESREYFRLDSFRLFQLSCLEHSASYSPDRGRFKRESIWGCRHLVVATGMNSGIPSAWQKTMRTRRYAWKKLRLSLSRGKVDRHHKNNKTDRIHFQREVVHSWKALSPKNKAPSPDHPVIRLFIKADRNRRVAAEYRLITSIIDDA